MNKDLNGGFGTRDDFGDSFFSKLLMRIKAKGVRLPVISFAFLQSILKEKGFEVIYTENYQLKILQSPDVILIYGTIVDYPNELRVFHELKQLYPMARIGFFGPFPAQMPHLFNAADFVIKGEAEAFFMNEYQSVEQLRGIISVQMLTDMDALPKPDFTNFPISSYNYSPVLLQRPFITLQTSKGCPYSCRFYCVYGNQQGAVIRQRTAEKVADDMLWVQQEYGVKGVQFRDPVFGLKKGYIQAFVDALKRKNVKMVWGIETRLDLLTISDLDAMYEVGLRNINVGIETPDIDIARRNRRLPVSTMHQEEIVTYCKKKGINITAFYIIGLEGDTIESAEQTIRYAKKLNTSTARFSVATPYPGTGFYAQLEKENRIHTRDYSRYNQFSLVFRHSHLTQNDINRLLNKAYRQYYLRLRFLLLFLRYRLNYWYERFAGII